MKFLTTILVSGMLFNAPAVLENSNTNNTNDLQENSKSKIVKVTNSKVEHIALDESITISTKNEVNEKIDYIEKEKAISIKTQAEIDKEKLDTEIRALKSDSNNSIDKLTHLSDSDKSKFKDEINKSNDLNSIKEISKNASKKDKSIVELNEYKEKTFDNINKLDYLSTSEKEDFMNEANSSSSKVDVDNVFKEATNKNSSNLENKTQTVRNTSTVSNQVQNKSNSYSTSIEAPNSKAQAIVDAAYAQLGVNQDCTMLVTNSLKAVGIYHHGWPVSYTSLGREVSSSEAKPGDIIYYENGGMGVAHVAVYIGNGQAIHGGWNGNTTTTFSAFVGSGIHFIRVA